MYDKKRNIDYHTIFKYEELSINYFDKLFLDNQAKSVQVSNLKNFRLYESSKQFMS